MRAEGIFTPPSLEGTLIFPGNIGGSHWGGVSVDPIGGRLIAPTNRLAHIVRLIPQADLHAARVANPGVEISRQAGTPYGMLRDLWWTPARVPCNPPPWGTLAAIDAIEGAVEWEVPLGRLPLPHPDAPRWGSPNVGGALVTAGGLIVMAGTMDEHLRAFDIDTGAELWDARLPAGGHAGGPRRARQ